MWDLENDEPLVVDRQFHDDFDPSWYTVKKELLEFAAESDPSAKEALDKLNQAKSACDLGCGAGQSSRAVVLMCENLQELDMVDGKPVISKYIQEELEGKSIKVNTYPSTQISKFLKTSPASSRDLIFFGGVINNGLTEEDIKKMAEILTIGGIVFETNETLLDKNDMSKYFEIKYDKRGGGFSRDTIWQKKSS